MYVEYVSDWKELKNKAESLGAHSMSVQGYYTFFNFKNVERAQEFLDFAKSLGFFKHPEKAQVNTRRPFTPAEVSIRNRA